MGKKTKRFFFERSRGAKAKVDPCRTVQHDVAQRGRQDERLLEAKEAPLWQMAWLHCYAGTPRARAGTNRGPFARRRKSDRRWRTEIRTDGRGFSQSEPGERNSRIGGSPARRGVRGATRVTPTYRGKYLRAGAQLGGEDPRRARLRLSGSDAKRRRGNLKVLVAARFGREIYICGISAFFIVRKRLETTMRLRPHCDSLQVF